MLCPFPCNLCSGKYQAGQSTAEEQDTSIIKCSCTKLEWSAWCTHRLVFHQSAPAHLHCAQDHPQFGSHCEYHSARNNARGKPSLASQTSSLAGHARRSRRAGGGRRARSERLARETTRRPRAPRSRTSGRRD